MNEKIMKILVPPKEELKKIEIYFKSLKKMEILSLILEIPLPVLLKKNIYIFLENNYKEIKMGRYLTPEEEEDLDTLHEHFDDVMNFFERYEEGYAEYIKDMEEEKENLEKFKKIMNRLEKEKEKEKEEGK